MTSDQEVLQNRVEGGRAWEDGKNSISPNLLKAQGSRGIRLPIYTRVCCVLPPIRT